MMDYYSEFDIPSIDIRRVYLKEYADKMKYTDVNLNSIILKIIKETPEYSLSGYTVFGKKEEQEKLDLIFKKD